MYSKKLAKMRIPLFLFALLLAAGCTTSRYVFIDDDDYSEESTAASEDFKLEMLEEPSIKGNSAARKQDSSRSTNQPYQGKVIAIPSLKMEQQNQQNSWIPQFLQDSLTGHFASLSGMTVLDRKNESVILTEQKLSESGLYSTDNAAEFGQLTSAEYVLTGSIQKLPSRYALNLRVNDITTNEVKASFNGQYSLADIENGAAVKDAIVDLFNGLGIALSERQITGLTKNQSAASSTKSLAQGMAAQKDGDFITALNFLTDASAGGNTEASTVISSMLNSQIPQDIQQRAAYYKEQTAKWQKIWDDFDTYFSRNLLILVTDFGQEKRDEKVSGDGTSVDLTWKGGLRWVPNRNALVLYNTICTEWEKVKNTPGNEAWTKEVRSLMNSYKYYSVRIGLYNKYGELLATTDCTYDRNVKQFRYKNEAVPPQFRLFDEARKSDIKFYSVKIDNKFAEPLSTKIIYVNFSKNYDTAYYGRGEQFKLTEQNLQTLQEWRNTHPAE